MLRYLSAYIQDVRKLPVEIETTASVGEQKQETLVTKCSDRPFSMFKSKLSFGKRRRVSAAVLLHAALGAAACLSDELPLSHTQASPQRQVSLREFRVAYVQALAACRATAVRPMGSRSYGKERERSSINESTEIPCNVHVWSSAGMKVRGKREIPEKNHRPVSSSGTIPTYENSGVIRPGIEPGSPWWEASRLAAQPPGAGIATSYWEKDDSNNPLHRQAIGDISPKQRANIGQPEAGRVALSTPDQLQGTDAEWVCPIAANRSTRNSLRNYLNRSFGGSDKASSSDMYGACILLREDRPGELLAATPVIASKSCSLSNVGGRTPNMASIPGSDVNNDGGLHQQTWPPATPNKMAHRFWILLLKSYAKTKLNKLLAFSCLSLITSMIFPDRTRSGNGNLSSSVATSTKPKMYCSKGNEKRPEPSNSGTDDTLLDTSSSIGVQQQTLYIINYCKPLFAFYESKPGSIPSRVTPGFSHVGIVPVDATYRRVFSGISRFPALSFWRCSMLNLNNPHRLSRLL
ncbi:hypothetical protein PR048_006906 [Dryococelus australis]|uniref:Uncharacterized protein n=1 Tax=Dryococelus australis TaxID=614101 RepID=A0ABQ9ID85_9NEOP|nr:hypothetical protein PR048_006906 [Dryococelus australis]